MLYPNQINSNFFRRMMMAGWYADREVVCEQLPLHLNELIGKNELEQFLKEIWYLSFIDDIFYANEYDEVKYYNILYSFGEITTKLVDYSEDDDYLNIYKKMASKKIRNFGYKDGREILIDEEGRIYFIPDSGDLYYMGAKFYEGLYNLIYNTGESYIASRDGLFINERTKQEFYIGDI